MKKPKSNPQFAKLQDFESELYARQRLADSPLRVNEQREIETLKERIQTGSFSETEEAI